jgi:hypothetical protein
MLIAGSDRTLLISAFRAALLGARTALDARQAQVKN